MSLYTINSDFLEILNREELTPEDMQALENLTDNERDKIVVLAGFIKNMESDLNGLNEAIDSMQKRVKRINNKIANLSQVIKTKMEFLGLENVDDSPYYEVKLYKNKSKVDIYDENLIPEEYWRERVMRAVSKEKIAEDIVNLGLVIPGANLISGKRVVIK